MIVEELKELRIKDLESEVEALKSGHANVVEVANALYVSNCALRERIEGIEVGMSSVTMKLYSLLERIEALEGKSLPPAHRPEQPSKIPPPDGSQWKPGGSS